MDSGRLKLLESLKVDVNTVNLLGFQDPKKKKNASSGGVSENKGVPTEMTDSLNDR